MPTEVLKYLPVLSTYLSTLRRKRHLCYRLTYSQISKGTRYFRIPVERWDTDLLPVWPHTVPGMILPRPHTHDTVPYGMVLLGGEKTIAQNSPQLASHTCRIFETLHLLDLAITQRDTH